MVSLSLVALGPVQMPINVLRFEPQLYVNFSGSKVMYASNILVHHFDTKKKRLIHINSQTGREQRHISCVGDTAGFESRTSGSKEECAYQCAARPGK